LRKEWDKVIAGPLRIIGVKEKTALVKSRNCSYFFTILSFRIKKRCAIILKRKLCKMEASRKKMNDHLIFISALFICLFDDQELEFGRESDISRVACLVHMPSSEWEKKD
jgi:hypothetical protein